MSENFDKHDIQGIVTRGYPELPFARFLLLAITSAKSAREYLRGAKITTAGQARGTTALQVAFTHPGLQKLGLPASALDSFSREFRGGMDQQVRAKALGDTGDNAPSAWSWGHASKPDAMLMLYAASDDALKALEAEVRAGTAAGFSVIATKSTSDEMFTAQREHFGWRDGISTPVVAEFGSKKIDSWTHPIRAGEFVLGYRNEFDSYSESPSVALPDDPQNTLPVARDAKEKDLGRNGTYLVYREMTQNVPRFWTYLRESSREPGVDRVASAVALGSKMVGRWPSGAPLQTSPVDDKTKADDNAFTYYMRADPQTGKTERDAHGLACPVGSHIRRSNPRDDLPADRGDKTSIDMVRKHQMIRRGRPFGKPLVESMDPKDLIAKEPDSEPRGLHFICLVSHIGRQFELVQRAWINSPVFGALSRDADPLIGVHHEKDCDDGNASDQFTCPAEPVRRTYKGMPQFTQLVGGAYFFLPGIRALRFIAGAP